MPMTSMTLTTIKPNVLALRAQPETALIAGEIRFPEPPVAEDLAATRAAQGIGSPEAHDISA